MQWILLGTKLVPLIIMAVQAVEKLVKAEKGPAKQDAAVDLVGTWLAALEAGLDRDVLDDADVQAGVRAVIDAYVHLQNVVAKARQK